MFKKLLYAVTLILTFFLAPAIPARAAEYLYNGNMAVEGSTDVLEGIDAKGRPDGWFPGGRGDNYRYYVYGTWAQMRGPAMRMAKVKISRYADGNASWVSQDVPVTAGQTLVLTHEYRSDVPSTLGVRYLINGAYEYRWLNTFPATNTFLQIPVRRRFTVPEGATHLAVYRSIASVGYLEVGNFSLVDPADVDKRDGENILFNSRLMEVDQNNEPVGWKRWSSTGSHRGYRWHTCSNPTGGRLGSPDSCPFERGTYLSIDYMEGGYFDEHASWYSEPVNLPPQQRAAPRTIEIGYRLASGTEIRTRALFIMADGTTDMKFVAINHTEHQWEWAGGSYLTAVEVPKDAVSFSLFLSRGSGQSGGIARYTDIKARLIDPGRRVTEPSFGHEFGEEAPPEFGAVHN